MIVVIVGGDGWLRKSNRQIGKATIVKLAIVVAMIAVIISGDG